MPVERMARGGAWMAIVIVALVVVTVAPTAGAKTKTRVFKAVSDESSIPFPSTGGDGITTVSNLVVKPALRRGKVKKVSVGVRADHPRDADLDMFLLQPNYPHPIELSTDNGGTGANYGFGPNNCSGDFAVFDDAATTAINAGVAPALPPFAGTFKPEQPLTVLKGSPIYGQWWLVVVDDTFGQTGDLGCWDLKITIKLPKK